MVPVVAGAAWIRAPRPAAGAALAGTLGAAPVVGWMARNELLTGFATGMSRTAPRALQHGLGPPDHLWGLLHTAVLDLFSADRMAHRHEVWVEPTDPFAWVLAAATLAPAVVALVRARPALGGPARAALALGLLHLASCFVLWSVSNNDPLVSRYVAPAWPPLVVAAVAAVARLRGAPRLAALLPLVAVLAVGAPKSAALLGPAPPDRLVPTRPFFGRAFTRELRFGPRDG